MKAITIGEAAGRFHYSVSHLRSLCASGQVRARRFGRAWAIDAASLAAYAAQEHKTGPKGRRS